MDFGASYLFCSLLSSYESFCHLLGIGLLSAPTSVFGLCAAFASSALSAGVYLFQQIFVEQCVRYRGHHGLAEKAQGAPQGESS